MIKYTKQLYMWRVFIRSKLKERYEEATLVMSVFDTSAAETSGASMYSKAEL